MKWAGKNNKTVFSLIPKMENWCPSLWIWFANCIDILQVDEHWTLRAKNDSISMGKTFANTKKNKSNDERFGHIRQPSAVEGLKRWTTKQQMNRVNLTILVFRFFARPTVHRFAFERFVDAKYCYVPCLWNKWQFWVFCSFASSFSGLPLSVN